MVLSANQIAAFLKITSRRLDLKYQHENPKCTRVRVWRRESYKEAIIYSLKLCDEKKTYWTLNIPEFYAIKDN